MAEIECPSCGSPNVEQIDTNKYQCPFCGHTFIKQQVATSQPPQQPGSSPAPTQRPDSNLVWAILTTLLCCLPLGIVAIVYASQVDSKFNSGDIQGALESSKKARNFAMWGAIAGGVVIILYILIYVIAGVAAFA